MEKDNPKKVVKISDIIPPASLAGGPLRDRLEPSLLEEKPEPEKEEKEETKEEAPVEKVEPPRVTKKEEEKIFPKDVFASKPREKKKVFITAGAICLVVLGIIFYFTLSKAEIIIKAKTETMRFQTELNIDKNIAFTELENNKIPGQLFQVEKESQREFAATQEKELREKARGTVTVYNQYSSASQTLVKTTRFVTEKGKVFRTTKTVVIPGAKVEEGQIIPSSIDVGIEAAEPGGEHNIGPSSFTIPGFKGTAKYTGFYGKSTQPMTGGVVGKVKVVSEEDIQGARDVLAVELKQKAKKELERKIPSNLKILEDTVLEEVVESSSNVEVDQPAEKFTMTVKVAAKSLGFDENDAISLINDNLKEKVSKNKLLIPDTIKIEYTIADINLEKGTAKLTCEVEEDVAWSVDAEEVKRALAGKNEVEVRQYLTSRSEIESAKVVFWPFWVKKIPSKEKKIKITID